MTDEQNYRCDRFRDRVMRTQEWKEQHEAHGAYTRTVEEPQPSSYTIATLQCPCGAKHYVMESKDYPQ